MQIGGANEIINVTDKSPGKPVGPVYGDEVLSVHTYIHTYMHTYIHNGA